MRKRRLGNTGLVVSEISLGTSQIGGKYEDVSERDAMETIESYLELGGNCIDTAAIYDSEKYIGHILKGNQREKIVLVTKTHHAGSMGQIKEMRRDMEMSLKQLNTDWIDVYLIHNPPEDIHTLEAVLSEMRRMKEQGYIRFIGASIKGHNVTNETVTLCREYMEFKEIDVFEIVYSILRQKIDYSGILEECHQRGIGLLARTVLEGGFLSGKYPPGYRFQEKDHRAKYSIHQLNKILLACEMLKSWIPAGTPDLTALSIQFALANPHLSSMILGAKTAEQIKKLVQLTDSEPLSTELLDRLKSFGLNQTEQYNLL